MPAARTNPVVDPIPSSPEYFAVHGGFAWFAAYDPVNGNSLWKSDGTQAGTSIVDPQIYPSHLAWAGSNCSSQAMTL